MNKEQMNEVKKILLSKGLEVKLTKDENDKIVLQIKTDKGICHTDLSNVETDDNNDLARLICSSLGLKEKTND